VLSVDEIPAPTPGPGEIAVEVHAAGVNPYETYMRDGLYPDLPLPCCPGRDAAGVVSHIGEGVTRFQPGDRVYLTEARPGAYAETVVAGQDSVGRLPASLSFAQGAAVAVPCLTAYRALFERGAAKAGETVLVHGASGSVGMAAVQLAKAAGLRVFGTAGTPEGIALLDSLGVEAAFSHREPNYLEAAKTAAGGGFDLILEMLANVNLDRDLGALRMRGRVVVIGNRGPIEINARQLMNCEGEIRAMMLFKASEKEMAEARAGVQAALESAVLVPRVSKEYPLEQAAEAQEKVLENGLLGKVVLSIR